MKKLLAAFGALMMSFSSFGADLSRGADNFYTSDKVTVQKVSFTNLYNMKVVGNLFVPKDLDKQAQSAAIIVGHPMGAVKEQSANLYATKMAEQGFVTLSFDLSYWGESEGEPRHTVAPDVYADDFSAAVDFLSTQPFVDRNNIGVIGICGSGGFSISAAKVDSRLKALATVSMYDMGGFSRNMYQHMMTIEQRQAAVAASSEQRYVEYTGGETQYTGGSPHHVDENSHPIAKEFYDFYRTERGEFTPEGDSADLTTHPTLVSNVKFLNFYPFNDIDTISPRPMLFIAGENAHSLEWSKEAYELAGEAKELYLVPNAGHVDLYDRVDVIPFAKLTDFFRTNLK